MYNEQEFKKDSVFSLLPSKGNGAAILGSLYFISGFSDDDGGVGTGGGRGGQLAGGEKTFLLEGDWGICVGGGFELSAGS